MLFRSDEANLPWVQKFNPYDLYSKNPNPPVLAELKPYYEDLLAKYLPAARRAWLLSRLSPYRNQDLIPFFAVGSFEALANLTGIWRGCIEAVRAGNA